MEKKEYTLGPNKIFVEQRTPRNKTYLHPLVLVHGSFGGYWMWNMIADVLNEKGFETFAFSLRGHKPSAKIDLGAVSMMDYRDDLALVVEELKLKDPVVVGHSMAGCIVLMYAIGNSVSAVVPIDPSPSVEVQGAKPEEEVEKIALVYDVFDAGMPREPSEVVEALPDVSQEMIMKMKDMLGPESGTARKDRKRGVSIPKEKLTAPALMLGAELGKSVPFGISAESTRKMAEYYDADYFEIQGATHPGMLIGKYAPTVAFRIVEWLKNIS